MAYTTVPAVDENNLFPPVVLEATAQSPQVQAAISALIAGKIIVDPTNESGYPNGTVFLYTT